MRQTTIRHEFVRFVPTELEPGVLYVSMEYATAVHLCCCGCGNKVVTPLAPGRWRLMYDGKEVSLDPSVGNWSFACQSHYWVDGGRVEWDRRFTESEIAEVRRWGIPGSDSSIHPKSPGLSGIRAWLQDKIRGFRS